MRRTVLSLAATLLLAAPALSAAELQPTDDTRAEVPELTAFHEVIYPLWHEAWPNRDAAMMRELLPQVREHLAAIEKAQLPGILRDKQGKWDAGVKQLRDIVGRYERAAANNDAAALANTVEELHAAYEGLVRLVRPVMKELDAYHQVLYRLYHHDWPGTRLDAVREDARALAIACQTLVGAPLPKRFASRETEVRATFQRLCDATAELQIAAAGSDLGLLGSVIEKVHSAYQAAEGMFE